MTKLIKISVPENIHLNIDETFDFIHKWLPRNYANKVKDLLADEDKKSASITTYIRIVKKKRIHNKKIYTALYRVALLNKKEIEEIGNTIEN